MKARVMPTAYERRRDSEIERGILITNLAAALLRTANMDIENDVAWGCAIKSATDFVARTYAEMPRRKTR